MESTQRLARTTGLLYLVIMVFGMFSPVVLETLVVPGDAVTTAQNILGSLGLFRISLAGWIVIVVADVAISATFYLLLEPVSRSLSLVAAGLRFAYTAILGAILLHLFEAFSLLTDTERGARLETVERQIMALSDLETFGIGFLLALVFFGVHLVALGFLLHRSGYVPRVLSTVLGVAGVGYILDSLGNFFVPAYGGAASVVLLTPALLGELGLTAWLLLKGVKEVDA